MPNLPYLLNAPGAWLSGILTPLTAQTVPAGQGLVSLSLSLPLGGGSLRDFNSAAIVVFLALLACYLTTYPVLKPAAFLLPSIVLFFATRSFGSYLVTLIPAALAAAATTQRPQLSASWRHWKWVVSGAAASCALAVLAALTSPSPLVMSVQSVRTTGQLATVDQVTVSVTNHSDRRVRPSFTVEDGMSMTAFWRRVHGPPALGPHQEAQVHDPGAELFRDALDHQRVPDPGLLARTAHGQPDRLVRGRASGGRCCGPPPSTSRSPGGRRSPCTPRSSTGSISRSGPRTCPCGSARSSTRRAARIASEATINKAYGGQTPVSALTNAQGIAMFTIRLNSPTMPHAPVYFEANLVKSTSAYPYGYSPILAVRFRK